MPKTEMDKTGKIIIKISIFFIILSVTAVIFSYIFNKWILNSEQASKAVANKGVIVIDAGHGGRDGGAVASDGTKESDLNLSLALMLGDMLESLGYNVVYTRTEDISLVAENSTMTRKMQDMVKRIEIINGKNTAVFVSLHMNKFTQDKYSGVQVFYSPNNDESRTLADSIQKNIKEFIQPDNNRKTKKAGSNIYLLDKAECVGVLVECGFLSNPMECEKLKNEQYRKELASVFCKSIVEFIEKV